MIEDELRLRLFTVLILVHQNVRYNVQVSLYLLAMYRLAFGHAQKLGEKYQVTLRVVFHYFSDCISHLPPAVERPHQ